MDTQIKIIKQLCKFEEEDAIKENVYSIDDFEENDTIFKFLETDNIYVTFVYDNSKYLVEYEDYDTGEMLIANPNERIHFSSGQTDTGAYVVGYFSIRVTISDVIKNYLFLVEPKTLDLQKVLNLRTYVNSFYNGLSLDLQRKRKIGDASDYEDNTSLFMNYHYLSDNFSTIMNHINNYINAKYVEPKKQNIITRKPKNMGPESIRWLAKKGFSKNNDLDNLSTILVNKTQLNIDNEQNRIFKSELIFWDNELKAIVDTIFKYYNSILQKLEYSKNELNDLTSKLEIIEAQKTVSQQIKKEERNKIKHKTDNYNDLNKIAEDYKQRITNIQHFRTSLENAEYNSWAKNVSIEKGKNFHVTNKRLLMLREMRDRYLGIKRKSNKEGGNKKTDYFSEKSTPKLFETYVYILLIRVLEEFGYEIDNDTYKEDLMFLLSNESIISLSKDNIKCNIYYDKELRKSNSSFKKSEYCVINSHHNKPDFLLSFCDENGLIDTIIVEVKWRPLKNIYNEVEDTEVVSTLKDYYNFAYYDADTNKTKRAVVSKVIVLYPDVEENYTDIQNEDIVAIGLNIDYEIKGTKGYNKLKNILYSQTEGN